VHPFINALPGISSKRYLELGILNGITLGLVKAREKVGVDISPVGEPTFLGTTDAYFANLPADERFDVVFIDACHEFRQVLRDFNNSVAHLNPGGVIFCHDMAPKGVENTNPRLCGDAYKLCWLAPPDGMKWAIYGGDDAGGAVFYNPHALELANLPADASYEAFERDFRALAVTTHEEFLTLCRLIGA